VRELEQRGVVEQRPGRTAAGIAREAAAAAPACAEDVRLVATLFDAVWYGGRTAEEADVLAARAADERLRRLPLRLAAVTPGAVAAVGSTVPTVPTVPT